MKKRTLIYVVTAVILPTIFQTVFSYIGSDQFASPLLNIVLLVAGVVLLALLVELGIFIARALRSPSTATMLESIDKLGNRYKLANGRVMFDVNDADYALLYADGKGERRFSDRLKNAKHIVYHSLSAKKHLNWIEFVFWDFLRAVRQELKCDIIVSMHYDEASRETGLYQMKDVSHYKELCDDLKVIAKKIIGSDITIIDEEDFHLKHSKFYAHRFHNIFIQKILSCVKEVDERKLNYSSFMRKLSYIESAFPIMVMTKRKNRASRLYILDRVHAHEMWNTTPLLEYKNAHNVFFINAQTLTDSQGKTLRVFSPEDGINVTDTCEEIRAKLGRTDPEMKRLMCSLMKSHWDTELNVSSLDEAELNTTALLLLQRIKSKYNL